MVQIFSEHLPYIQVDILSNCIERRGEPWRTGHHYGVFGER
jgi:hypothetical protein